MTTIARTNTETASHYYYPDGTPCYEVENKSKGGMRRTTISDARKLGLYPSVTTILSILEKPALTAWKIENACLAVLTTPPNPGESLDAFVERVLHTERQQDAEAQAARDLGTAIHDAMERWFSGQDVPPDLRPWIEPAARAVGTFGSFVAAEKILVGDGYAGRTDLILESPASWWIFDTKSAKKLPDPDKGGAWLEHRLQLGAYAAAFFKRIAGASATMSDKPIRVANCYISTAEQGKFVIIETEDWQREYDCGFAPCVQLWQHINNYKPTI